MKKVTVAALIALVCGLCSAQTTMYGIPTCADWFRPGNNAKEWMMGYLSGVAQMDTKNQRVLSESTAPQGFLWMDNYCRAYPLNDLVDGSNALYLELLKRHKQQS